MVSPHILSILILMLSWPLALFELRLIIKTITFFISSVVTLVVRNLLSVTYMGFVGSLPYYFNNVHWLEKKELKS